jgi:hypothetical protein
MNISVSSLRDEIYTVRQEGLFHKSFRRDYFGENHH